jgi:hypothetical protein
MSLNGTMILKDTQGKLLTTQLEGAIPVGFNGGTPLVQDRRITITSSAANLWKNAGLSYDLSGRLAVTSSGPARNWIGGIPVDLYGRVFISENPVVWYSQDGIPITFNGAVSMGASYAPGDLFLNNEEGLWLDPSDFSTMFQDTAGNIPVTAEGQQVGLILDKSGNEHHATFVGTKPLLLKDEVGLYYLDWDGISTGMETDLIDFSTTNKLTIWAGIRKAITEAFHYL